MWNVEEPAIGEARHEEINLLITANVIWHLRLYAADKTDKFVLSHAARCVRHVRPRPQGDGKALVRPRDLVRSGALVNWMAEQGCELHFEVGWSPH